MAEKFKTGDLVEVTLWKSDHFRKDWVIIELVSNDSEAVVRHSKRNEQTIVELSKLKHQEN